MKYRRTKNSKPIPVLLDQALRDRIEAVSERMGEPKSTVMRIAMRLGLDGLERALLADPAALTKEVLAKVVYPEHSPQLQIVEEKPSSASSAGIRRRAVAAAQKKADSIVASHKHGPPQS